MLKQAKSSPDIDNYLCYLLSNQDASSKLQTTPEKLHVARSAAGIMLKNDIKANYGSMSQTSKQYIRAHIVRGLNDPNAQIRNYSGNVITEIIRVGGVLGWPELLPELVSLVSNSGGTVSSNAQEGGMTALLKICEDNKKALNKYYQNQRPADFLIPKLIELTSSPIAKVRANAISSLNVFLEEKSEAMMANFDTFLSRLFGLANDSSEDVKKRICRAIVRTTEVAPGKIAPHMGDLVKYMIGQQQNNEDPDLALEAAEFWLTVGEDQNLRPLLGPYLGDIIPVLLESMIYDEDDVLRLEAEAEADDANLQDREQDIKPQFASAKASRGTTNGSGGGYSRMNDDDLSDGEIEDDDDDDLDEGGEDPEEQWNLRKCSAAALDVLATVFQEPVFRVTLPYLMSNLNHQEWPNREAAVLAIGAISEGCIGAVEPHLPDIIPYLISLLDDKNPVVRKITCWSLGRYSGWAAHLDSVGKDRFFLPMMDGILKRMLDGNKRVQEAAASAFATLEEKSGRELENPKYCEVIARQFAECFAQYKDRNMFILYDCVQTLAENVGPTLQSPELVHYLMPALMQRWEKVSDQSQEIFPLLECLSYIATALGNTFSPYSSAVYGRCIKMIYQSLNDSMAAAENPGLEKPDKDFLITSLDLLSSMVQALDPAQTQKLLKNSTPQLFDLLPLCLEDANSDARQSAFALLGDCAIFIFDQLQPHLAKVIPRIISQLDFDKASEAAATAGYPVMNNACWSCGEISIRAGEDMRSYVDTLLQGYYGILVQEQVAASLKENAAIALGRLGYACPEQVAPHLATVAPLYLKNMMQIAWTEEKSNSLAGICKTIFSNPQGLENTLVDFLALLSTASEPQPGCQKVRNK